MIRHFISSELTTANNLQNAFEHLFRLPHKQFAKNIIIMKTQPIYIRSLCACYLEFNFGKQN